MDQHPPIAPIADLLLDRIELIPGGTVRLCNPLVYINAGKFSTDFRRRQFWRDTALHEPQAAISFGRYAQAEVTGMGPHILMSQGCIAAEYIPTNYSVDDLARRIGEMYAAQHHPRVIDEPVVYAAYPGLRIWGHWLLEMLPRIALIERIWPGRFCYVVPRDLAPGEDRFLNHQVAASLAAYGVAPSRILVIDPGHLYRFSNLYDFTGMTYPAHAMHPALFDVLRAIPGLPPGGRRLGLTSVLRSADQARSLTNYNEIRAVLESERAGMLDPGAAPFLAQVQAFRDSDMIVGEMGSNLAGVIFARPGTAIISLAPCGWDDGFLPRLLQMTGAYFADVRGVSEKTTHDEMRTAAYSIDPAELKRAIDAMREILRAPPQADVVIADGRVIARHMGDLRLEIRFGAGGNDEDYSLRGFYDAEDGGRWSEGAVSSLCLQGFDAGGEGLWLEIEGIGHEIPPVLIDTVVEVSVNGEKLARFDVGHVTRLQVPVEAELAALRTPIEIEFHHPTCPPFGSVAPSSDMRQLGFFYQRLRVRRRVEAGHKGEVR